MRTITTTGLRWGLVVLLALGGLGSSAAPGATLRWKFKEGEALHYEMVQKTTTTLRNGDVPGQEQAKEKDQPPEKNQAKEKDQEQAKPGEFKTTVTQTIDMTWTVKAVNPDGSARMVQTIDRIRTRSQSPIALGNYEFDSKTKKEPEGPVAKAMATFLKALVGAEFSFNMSPQGELTDVKVPPDVVKALREAGPVGAGPASSFSEEGLKNMITQSSFALPKEDLAKGSSWTRQAKIPSPPVGTMVLDKTYRYVGVPNEEKKDKPGDHEIGQIELTFHVGFEDDPQGGIKIEVVKQKNTGAFAFDQTAGRIISSRVDENLEMKLTTAMGQNIYQSIDALVSMKLLDPSK